MQGEGAATRRPLREVLYHRIITKNSYTLYFMALAINSRSVLVRCNRSKKIDIDRQTSILSGTIIRGTPKTPNLSW
jgi:hypothetical protein